MVQGLLQTRAYAYEVLGFGLSAQERRGARRAGGHSAGTGPHPRQLPLTRGLLPPR
ncbi:hypothetical protein ACWDZ8_23030 [Streptomyces sp. NPDC003233]